MRCTLLRILPVVVLGGGLAGCRGPVAGATRSQSLRDYPVALESVYRDSAFDHDPEGGWRFILTDAAPDQTASPQLQDGQMLQIDLLWLPKAGATPLEPTGTNATIRHVIVSGGEVGVYAGAGFIVLDGSPDSDTVAVVVRDSSIRLQRSTPGFVDLLGTAQLTGSFRSERNDAKAQQLQRTLNLAAGETMAHR